MAQVPNYQLTLKQLAVRCKRLRSKDRPSRGARRKRYDAELKALGSLWTVRSIIGDNPLPTRVLRLQKRIEQVKARLEYDKDWTPTWKEFIALDIQMLDEIGKLLTKLGVPPPRNTRSKIDILIEQAVRELRAELGVPQGHRLSAVHRRRSSSSRS